ncbi:MAG: DUF1045 domain-containing protein [Pseudomonadota bacterium]
MSGYERYALYYTPPTGSALGAFGSAWLGWDADAGVEILRPAIEGLPEPIPSLTAAPSRYGFHGTLRAPFRLKEGLTEKALLAAVFDFCEDEKPFEAPALRLSSDLGFVCLRPTAPSEALSAFAMGCVRNFRGLAAQPTESELAKRRAVGLTPNQEEMLTRWGYPYVGEEYRFHMTLTKQLSADAAAAVLAVLAPRIEPLLSEPTPVRELCLFGDPGHDGHFRLVRRFRLKG